MQRDAIALLVSQRYAEALYQWAQEENAIPKVSEELAVFADAFDDNFYAVMANPSVTLTEKLDLVSAIGEKASVAVKNLLALLAEHQRLPVFPEVVGQYNALVDQAAGKVRGTLFTATKVDQAVLDQVANAAKTRFGYTAVELVNQVHPELLGGAQLQIGDQRIDGSYLSQLNQLAAISH